jgi:hypothetical protein
VRHTQFSITALLETTSTHADLAVCWASVVVIYLCDVWINHPRGRWRAHHGAGRVACSRCKRAERYNLDTLITRHGEGFGIPKLLRLLSKDCVKSASVSAYDLCGVHCPELPAFFLSTTVCRATE